MLMFTIIIATVLFEELFYRATTLPHHRRFVKQYSGFRCADHAVWNLLLNKDGCWASFDDVGRKMREARAEQLSFARSQSNAQANAKFGPNFQGEYGHVIVRMLRSCVSLRVEVTDNLTLARQFAEREGTEGFVILVPRHWVALRKEGSHWLWVDSLKLNNAAKISLDEALHKGNEWIWVGSVPRLNIHSNKVKSILTDPPPQTALSGRRFRAPTAPPRGGRSWLLPNKPERGSTLHPARAPIARPRDGRSRPRTSTP